MKNELKFRNNRFRIMVTTDGHEECEFKTKKDRLKAEDYLRLQYAALDYLKPDLVVLDGDNAYGDTPDEMFPVLKRITKPYEKNNVPFAFVLGNHEPSDDPVKVKEIYNLYRQLPTCLLPAENECSYMGDYNLTVLSEDGKRNVLNLWLINSGDKAPKGYYSDYAFVRDEQIEWYKNKAQKIKEENGYTVPAVLFQHICVPEEFRLLNEHTNPVMRLFGAVKGIEEQSGKYYTLNKKIASGHLGEDPCPPGYNNGQFRAWKETGDVFAAFFGHDHTNDFIGMTEGITLGQCITSGFNSYGDKNRRGVRVIDIYENNPACFDTRSIYYKEITGRDAESLKL